jgi:hypothetical protein
MKKRFYAMVPVLLLAACSEAASTFTNSSPLKDTATASPIQETSGTILVTGPLTLSRNDLFPLTNKHEYLSVVLTNGKYFEDWSPGPFIGRNWAGEFQIRLTDENGEVMSAVDLNRYFQDEIVFNSFFDIEFDDYNGDGNLDFTIGQYASSNGSTFKLFTLDKSGRIEELPIEGQNGMFVSGTGRYSAKLARHESGFSTIHYDNRIGKEVIQSYTWNGREFVRQSQDDLVAADSEYDATDLEMSLPKGWKFDSGDPFDAVISDENGVNLGSVIAYPYADDFDFRQYKPNHSEIVNEEPIDTPIGSGKLYTLDADNGTAASGITGTHDVYFAVIPIPDKAVYVIEFSRHDQEAATKKEFISLLSGLRIMK